MLYKKYFGLHETESSTSVAILLLVVRGGLVKRGGDRGKHVHGTVSSAAGITLLLVGGVGVEERR